MKKYALSLFVASILVGCSTSKDTFQSRNYHKITSWYNGLFNAEEQLEIANKNLIENFQEDYSKILPIGVNYYGNNEVDDYSGENIPTFGINNNSTKQISKPTGYDAVEKKALSVIEKHSMMIQGQEKNTMIARAYLLIGKSKFQRGQFFEALDAFNYVTQNFKDTKYFNEASTYAALSNIKGGNYFDGQEKLLALYDNESLPKNIQYIVASNYADFLIENEKYEDAIEPLKKADYFSKNGPERYRVLFALGQVYSKLGKQIEAGEIFSNLYKLKPGFEMEVKTQLAIAENFDPKINNYNNYKTHLLDQAKKGIYTSKKNEFYYAIAEMALRNGNLDEATEYSKLSLKEPISDEWVRGKTYENFANINLAKSNYLYATAYFDSAVTSFTKKEHKEPIAIKNKVLKELMEKHYLVEKNDSILKLTSLSKDEQQTYFSKHIESLRAKEEKKIVEDQKQVEEFQLAGKVSSFDNDKSNKFYFYNQSLKSNGKVEFQRIWNNVVLQDDWRNTSKSSLNAIEQKESELKGTLTSGDPRRFDIDYYTEKIPTSASEINELKITRDTTQLALGIGYYDYFENVDLADKTLTALLASPPKNKETELKAIYQLYRIHKDRDKSLENKYKDIILNQYPNTIYAGYILNPDVDYISEETKEALEDYKNTYAFFKNEDYKKVKSNVAEALTKYPTEIIVAKFALLNAFAISKTESQENFKNALEIVAVAYENTEEGKYAKKLLGTLNNPTENKEESKPTEKISNTNTIERTQINDLDEPIIEEKQKSEEIIKPPKGTVVPPGRNKSIFEK